MLKYIVKKFSFQISFTLLMKKLWKAGDHCFQQFVIEYMFDNKDWTIYTDRTLVTLSVCIQQITRCGVFFIKVDKKTGLNSSNLDG